LRIWAGADEPGVDLAGASPNAMAKPKTDDKARNAAQAAVWRALQDAYDAVGGQDGDEGAQEALESVGDDLAGDWASDGFRTRLGADVAVRGAMGEASYERLTGDEFDQGGGYLMFVAILDSSTTELCSALGEPSVVLPASHPFWSSHSPPMHANCRSYLVGLTPEEAEEAGITDSPPDIDADDGFGGPGGYYGTAPVESDYDVSGGNAGGVEWGE
jgi:hypothetical protein